MISQIRKLIQDKLISGVNIKTINGSDILGPGNLTVSGSGVPDGDKGDITVSSSGTVWTIDNNAVTNAKINDVDWSKVTGEPTTLGGYGISDTKANFNTACSDGDFLFVGDIIGLTDGDKGDITVSASGATWNIDAATVGVTELSATGTANNTTFLRGDNTWATPTSSDPAGWTTIVKSANQDVVGSTLVDDTELQFSVVAGGSYLLEMIVATSGNSSVDDYKFGFLVSSGTMIGAGNVLSRTAALAASNTALSSIGVSSAGPVPVGSFGGTIPSSSGVQAATAFFSFTASANAIFKMQFACNTGTTSTARTWKGSILKYKRLD